MTKEMEFRDYTARVEDSDGDPHESTVRAHVVNDDTKDREIVTRVGTQVVAKDHVLVETDAPGVYDVLTPDAWKSTGYAAGDDSGNADGEPYHEG